MKFSVGSVLSGLLVTIALAIPVHQAQAHFISSGADYNHKYSGSDFEKDFDDDDWKDGFDWRRGSDWDKESNWRDGFEWKDGFNWKDGFEGFCERQGDCGNYKERYCSCDGGKCDDGNQNVPEPTPLVLLGLGLGVIGLVRRFTSSRRD
jgi:hypothetical protein